MFYTLKCLNVKKTSFYIRVFFFYLNVTLVKWILCYCWYHARISQGSFDEYIMHKKSYAFNYAYKKSMISFDKKCKWIKLSREVFSSSLSANFLSFNLHIKLLYLVVFSFIPSNRDRNIRPRFECLVRFLFISFLVEEKYIFYEKRNKINFCLFLFFSRLFLFSWANSPVASSNISPTPRPSLDSTYTYIEYLRSTMARWPFREPLAFICSQLRFFLEPHDIIVVWCTLDFQFRSFFFVRHGRLHHISYGEVWRTACIWNRSYLKNYKSHKKN